MKERLPSGELDGIEWEPPFRFETDEDALLAEPTLADLMSRSTKQSPSFQKDLSKARRATQFVGQGSPRSSTHAYAVAMAERANTGRYGPDDVVFVSCEGNRGGRFRAVVDGVPQGHYGLLDAVIASGASVVMDVPYDRGRSYNVGEREVADYLVSMGMRETSPGVFRTP